jgi:hypothetical protein
MGVVPAQNPQGLLDKAASASAIAARQACRSNNRSIGDLTWI